MRPARVWSKSFLHTVILAFPTQVGSNVSLVLTTKAREESTWNCLDLAYTGAFYQSFLTAAARGSDSHWHHPECGPHSKALKVKAKDRRETRWKNDLFMLLPSCVRMGTHGAYTVWIALGSWPCVIQVTRCSNHPATDAVSPSPRKYLISCTMQK